MKVLNRNEDVELINAKQFTSQNYMMMIEGINFNWNKIECFIYYDVNDKLLSEYIKYYSYLIGLHAKNSSIYTNIHFAYNPRDNEIRFNGVSLFCNKLKDAENIILLFLKANKNWEVLPLYKK